MANRHLSRSIVLQTLFEWDFVPARLASEGVAGGPVDKKSESNNAAFNIDEALKRNLKEFAPGAEDDTFTPVLLSGVVKNHAVIDEIIEKAAPEWPIDKISIVDRNILRIGLYELLFGDRSQVPPKVAINEAIELAKTFGGENSSKFVNGVLGAVYKEIGEPGKDQKSKGPKKDEPLDHSKLQVENLGGSLVYSRKGNEVFFAMVHDVFGYWTLSKSKIEPGETVEDGTKRAIKKEIGLDIVLEDKLGENEYVASHPEKGKSLKRVTYFLGFSEYHDLVLEKSGGLDGARWFPLAQITELRMYNDMIPIIKKAIEIISSK